jgi:hypothetical protein
LVWTHSPQISPHFSPHLNGALADASQSLAAAAVDSQPDGPKRAAV